MKPEEPTQAEDQELADALKEYRAAARDVARRDQAFWEKQRLAIMTRIAQRQPGLWSRYAMAWSLSAIIVLVVIGLTVEVPRSLPVPDIAGGYDQDLLYDVDRLLREPVPSALEPAMVLVGDISAGPARPLNGVVPEPEPSK